MAPVGNLWVIQYFIINICFFSQQFNVIKIQLSFDRSTSSKRGNMFPDLLQFKAMAI